MVRIVADTTCGVPKEILQHLGIPLIPQVVIFGEESYHDNELDTATFLQKLKNSPTLPKTSAPEPSLYNPIFSAAAQSGDSVIVIAPMSKASGTVRSAQVAAQNFPGVDIHVVDTMTISCNLATLVLQAHEMACQGKSAAEILDWLNGMMPHGQLYFLVDTLEYLAKGGRIGGAKKLLAELLEIRPILQVKNGQVEPFEQHRTKKKATARLVDLAIDRCKGVPQPYLCLLHVEAEAEARALHEQLMAALPLKEIPIYELPPAIVVHAGPKTLGVGFYV
jgi:DegV family protein with EDD domain